MGLLVNTADGFVTPVSDAPDRAWVIEQDLHHLASPPDTKILSKFLSRFLTPSASFTQIVLGGRRIFHINMIVCLYLT